MKSKSLLMLTFLDYNAGVCLCVCVCVRALPEPRTANRWTVQVIVASRPDKPGWPRRGIRQSPS